MHLLRIWHDPSHQLVLGDSRVLNNSLGMDISGGTLIGFVHDVGVGGLRKSIVVRDFLVSVLT